MSRAWGRSGLRSLVLCALHPLRQLHPPRNVYICCECAWPTDHVSRWTSGVHSASCFHLVHPLCRLVLEAAAVLHARYFNNLASQGVDWLRPFAGSAEYMRYNKAEGEKHLPLFAETVRKHGFGVGGGGTGGEKRMMDEKQEVSQISSVGQPGPICALHEPANSADVAHSQSFDNKSVISCMRAKNWCSIPRQIRIWHNVPN